LSGQSPEPFLAFEKQQNMKNWTTTKGTQVIRVLSGAGNAYLILSGEKNILVDTGVSSSQNRLNKNVRQIMDGRGRLDTLVLTHSHYDHCQGAYNIRERYGSAIVMGQAEARYAEQGYTPLPRGTFWLSHWLTSLGNRMGTRRFGYKPFTPDQLISADQNLDQQNTGIQIIQTGGHTAGSLSVVVDQEIALVGDTIFGIFPNSIYPPFADDRVALLESWGKLLKTPCRVFLPGHGKAIKREMLQKKYDKIRGRFSAHGHG
jgi:glyoxylase-like metal-dependent hydrolase (beta-lactamase superfamily II)